MAPAGWHLDWTRMGEDMGQVMVGSGHGHCWAFLTNLSINPSYKPASPVLGIYPRQIKTYELKKNSVFVLFCFSKFTAVLFTSIQKPETSQRSIVRGMDKQRVVHPYNVKYSAKGEKNTNICNNMGLTERGLQSSAV